MAQEPSKMPQDASKRPQEASKRPPGGPKIDFSSQLGRPEPQNSLKIYYEYNSFGPQSTFGIKSILYDVWAPIWHQNPTKMPPRCLQEALKRSKLVPKTAQEPPKRRPRRLKNRPRSILEEAQSLFGARWGPRAAPEPPKSCSDPPPDLDFGPFWQQFDRDFEPF